VLNSLSFENRLEQISETDCRGWFAMFDSHLVLKTLRLGK